LSRGDTLTAIIWELALRIVFIDVVKWTYSPNTVDERPLGGMQSAVCYLSRALVRAGHDVFWLNRRLRTEVLMGVTCLPLEIDSKAMQRLLANIAPQAIVVVGLAGVGIQIRPLIPVGSPLVLWTGHAHVQPASAALANSEDRDAWDAYVFVGTWQLESYIRCFNLDRSRCIMLGNAVPPAFETLFPPGERIVEAKGEPPTVVYTSTPFRGLKELGGLFPRIRARLPAARLKIFSSMSVYQVPEANDPYRDLYERLRGLDGVLYVGSVPQPRLAEELRCAAVLAYPNTFAETSCIAVMEAMAAGCAVVTTDLGALRETTAGFATLIAPPVESESYREQFVEAVVERLVALTRDRQATEEALRKQVSFATTAYNWNRRAQQWVMWLPTVVPRGPNT
jgi:glycosyltransferase involved in cell wall biosynthesis